MTDTRPALSHEEETRTAGAERIADVLGELPGRWLMASTEDQRLYLIERSNSARIYGISTAANGLNGAEGSFGTPPGVHRIARKIGIDQPPGAWFVSREPQDKVWRPGDPVGEDLILSRILTLDGCEEGVNHGSGCDSLQRFIYIHGTNHENRIGEPVSNGCIRMSNTDVIHLFERVEEGDPLVII